MNKNISIIALIAAIGAPSFAQDVVYGEEITRSANLDATPVAKTGANVTVLKDNTIEPTNETQLAETLSKIPGVSMSSNGGFGQPTYVNINGANQNNIGVYVDGIDVTDPSLTQVNYNFGGFLASDASSIEVLKGSNGAVYSGKAVGGVINIESKRPTKLGVSNSASIEYGSNNSVRAGYGFGFKNDATEVALNYSYAQTDGYNVGEAPSIDNPFIEVIDNGSETSGNREADAYEGQRISASVKQELTRNMSIGANVFTETSNGHTDDQAYGADGRTIYIDGTEDDTFNSTTTGARAYLQGDYGQFSYEASVSKLDTERTYQGTSEVSWPPGTFSETDITYTGERLETKVVGHYQPVEMFKLSLGANQVEESYASEGIAGGNDGSGSGESTLAGVFGEVVISPSNQIDMTLSARQDDHSDFGKFESYRANVAYRPVDGVTLKASYGTGYRAPSLFELNSVYNVGLLGPETSESLDVSVRVGNDKNFAELGAFKLTSDDYIAYDFSIQNDNLKSGYGAYTNVSGETVREGVSLSGQTQISDRVIVNAAATRISTENPDGDPLGRVPETSFTLGVKMDVIENVSLHVDATHSKGLVDYVYNNNTYSTDKVELDDFTIVNAKLGYKLGEGEVYARVENLFNEQYQTAYGYASSDRAYYVGYRANF